MVFQSTCSVRSKTREAVIENFLDAYISIHLLRAEQDDRKGGNGNDA